MRKTFRVTASLILLALCGCDAIERSVKTLTTSATPKLVVILVDLSGSIAEEDWGIYRDTTLQVAGSDELHPGDRIVLGTIGEGSLTSFRPTLDVALPRTGVPRDDREHLEMARQQLLQSFDGMRESAASRSTKIVDAVQLAQQLFRSDPERPRRVLILLSDMVEESEVLDFAQRPPSRENVKVVVDGLGSKGRCPDLGGAEVYAIGASAKTAEAMLAIEAFWLAFFKASNAVCEPGMYGRAGLRVRMAEATR